MAARQTIDSTFFMARRHSGTTTNYQPRVKTIRGKCGGLTFPGFMSPRGSIVRLMVFMRLTVPSPNSARRYPRFPSPMPCSPVPRRKKRSGTRFVSEQGVPSLRATQQRPNQTQGLRWPKGLEPVGSPPVQKNNSLLRLAWASIKSKTLSRPR